MIYYSNHCTISDSIHGGNLYYRHTIQITEHLDHSKILEYVVDPDWSTLVEVKDYFSPKAEERHRAKGLSLLDAKNQAIYLCPYLRDDIIEWLNALLPPKSPADFKTNPHPWSIQSEEKRILPGYEMTIGFYRRSDALAFVEKWSIYKKPITHFNYMTGTSKELNLKTGKYHPV